MGKREHDYDMYIKHMGDDIEEFPEQNNKWLNIGVTPEHIAKTFAPSEYEIKKEKRKKYSAKGGAGGVAHSKRKDFTKQIYAIYEKFGHGEFTYQDIVDMFNITRYTADKLLLMIRRRTTILTHRKMPRTHRGNSPAIYSIKPGWEAQMKKDLEAFNASNPSLTRRNY